MFRLQRVAVAGFLATAALLACSEENANELILDPQFAPGGSVNVDLDQCANDPTTDPCTWQNGNLNGNNSVYAEGRVVPFRLAIEGTTAGSHTIHINHDFTAGGHKAYDYLASFDATENVNICAVGGGGRSTLCDQPGDTSFGGMPGVVTTNTLAFGVDGFVDPESGKMVSAAVADGGVPTLLTIYGGSIISVSAPVHDGPTDGNSTSDILVTFNSTGTAVALAWGGHLAKSTFWNAPTDPDGSGQVSGAPWHMRTQQFDNTGGNKNQDRSIQPSALVADPMIAISKTVVNDSISAGDTLRFKINVWNEGEGDALNVTLEDTLPAGFSWTEDSADCVIASDILSCGFGDLMQDDTVMVTISTPTDPDDCGQVPNVAHATASNDTTVTAGDTATVLCPSLMIEKTAAADTVSAGDTISFTIIVWNPGPGDADSVMLTDTLPDGGLSWFEDPANADCSIAAGILTCDFGTLMADDTSMVSVSAVTDADDCGTVTNRAWADASNSDPVNDTADVVVQCPNLMIKKTALADTVNAGDSIGFKILVWNPGPGVADSVILTDTLPDDTGLSWTENSGDCSISGGILSCDFGDMEANDTSMVTIKSPTTADTCGTVDNRAWADANNSDAVNDTADVVVQCPNLMIKKTALADTVNAGDSIGFKILVWNPGPGVADSVILTDTLPDDTGLSWTENSADCSIAAGILSCDFGDMMADDSAMVTIKSPTTADTCGTVDNRAWADANNGDAVNDTADVVVQCPDIDIRKTAAADTVSAGDTISFTIEVWNDGPGVADSVTLTDTLPNGGLSWFEDPANADCSIAAGILSCDFGDMEANDSAMVTVSAVTDADDCGTVNNRAWADATNDDAVNDTADIVVQCPDIDIRKTAAADTVSAGDTISFTIEVWNDGPGVADSVTLTDTLPDGGLSWFEDPANADCSIAAGILSCDFGDMEANDTSSVTISAATDADDCGTVNNRAWADAKNDDAVNDTADIVVLCPSIMIDKEAVTDTVSAGDTITFKVIVWNPGPGDADSVMLTDTLPNGGLSWFEDPANADCSITSGILTCDFGEMMADDSAMVTVSAVTDAADCGTVVNTAYADAANDTTVSDTDSLVVQCPDIDIRKTAAADTVSAGDTISFTIEVWNDGPGVADSVTLTDTLPNGGLSWFEDPANADCSIAAGILSCDFGDLEANDTSSVTISAATDADDCGTVNNRAWADAKNDDAVNDTADIVVQCPDIDIRKTAAADTVSAGDTISFTIEVWNDGPGVADSVTLTDTLPNGGLSWFEDPANADCSIAAGILSCSFGTLMEDDTSSVTISAATDADDCGTVNNRAWADADNDDAVNDTADVVVQCPDIDIRKTAAADTVSAGDTISFTIEVWNDGPGDADNVTLTDTLPNGGLSWFEDPANADCSITSGILTCDFGTLMEDDTSSVTVSAETDTADCGTVTNTGHAVADNDTSVMDIDSLVVQCPGVGFILLDEDAIDNGLPPNFFNAPQVNDNIADIGLRKQLKFFAQNVGDTITLYSGEVGDEGWFSPQTIPDSWASAGPTGDGLRNFVGDPTNPPSYSVGPGLGTGADPEILLDEIPDVIPLRADGLYMLIGMTLCAVVYDSDISINYGPIQGNLQGANLGTVAFLVLDVRTLLGLSSSTLPEVDILILDADVVCNNTLTLKEGVPIPDTSSEPFDILVPPDENP